MKRQFAFFLILLAAGFARCGSMLDLSGRGAKTGCLYLETGSLKIIYDCDKRGISEVVVREKKKPADRLIFKTNPDPPVREFVLPVNRDSLDNRNVEIELHLSDPPPREAYYIDIKTGDLVSKTKIYARYYGH